VDFQATNEKRFPFIIVDAMVIKVREEGEFGKEGY